MTPATTDSDRRYCPGTDANPCHGAMLRGDEVRCSTCSTWYGAPQPRHPGNPEPGPRSVPRSGLPALDLLDGTYMRTCVYPRIAAALTGCGPLHGGNPYAPAHASERERIAFDQGDYLDTLVTAATAALRHDLDTPTEPEPLALF